MRASRRTARPRYSRTGPSWAEAVGLPLVEFPLRLVGAALAARLALAWLGDDTPPYVDLIESRFLVLFIGGSALIGFVAAPYFTTRPWLLAVRLTRRLGAFRLLGAAAGLLLGLAIGALFAVSLPRGDGPAERWLPVALSLGLGLLGAVTFAGRPGLFRRVWPRRLTVRPRIAAPRTTVVDAEPASLPAVLNPPPS